MNWWKRCAVAASVACLYYLCQIGPTGVELKRYLSQWDAQDTVAVVLGIVLFAGLAVAADWLVTRSASPLVRRIANHLFLMILAAGVLSVLGFFLRNRPNAIALGWMAAMFLIGSSFARPQLRLDHYAARVCLIFSPAVLLIPVTMFLWSTWPNPVEPVPPIDTSAAKRTPVYFFVFDEWSYPRTSEKEEIIPALKNLRDLAKQSVTFTDARSPAAETLVSVPDYLFQNDKTLEIAGGEVYFRNGDSRVLTRQVPSLFSTARQNGYQTSLLGFYHSYRALLGDQVDYCHVYPFSPYTHRQGDFLDTFLWRVKRNAVFFKDPISLHLKLDERFLNREWFDTRAAFRKEMLEMLASPAANTFAFFHSPWPHGPFVCNPDGSFCESPDARIGAYLRELQYLDTVVGDIVSTLRSAKKYDDAILIFTSDHSWRIDPDPKIAELPEHKRRVPLIIKLPGEKTSHVIYKQSSANRLPRFFEAAFSGERDPETLLRLLEESAAQAPDSADKATPGAPESK